MIADSPHRTVSSSRTISEPAPAPAAAGAQAADPVTTGQVLRLWWPLAASWLLMGVETPLFAAVVVRMPIGETSLAAYGSLVLPVALVIEAPIMMLLAASTALVRDRASYAKLYRFTMAAGAALTVAHAAVAFTPLFDPLARDVFNLPPQLVEPARSGLRLMTLWTWAIAHRRFQQGVLIRYGRSRVVGVGTAVRLVAFAGTLVGGALLTDFAGIAVGTVAVSAGVLVEALFVALAVRPVVRALPEHSGGEPLTRASFLRFYVPLATTPLLTLLIQPLGAAAMTRMPMALPSLTAWPAVWGLLFLLRSIGFAFNEVVVTLLGRPGAVSALRTFARRLALATSGILVVFVATPLAPLWFGDVTGLSEPLTALASSALAVGVLMPAYGAIQNLYQGALVHGGRTRGITEAVALYLVVATLVLVLGVLWSGLPAIHYALGAFTVGGVLQTAWLRWRARPVLARLAD